MKTVMKRVFSLMLVAVLLMSAVPFQASAAETTLTIELTLAPDTYNVEALAADKYNGSSTNYWVHRFLPSQEDYTTGDFEAVEGGTYVLYVVETVADPTPATITCPTCQETYTEDTKHTCPTVTCNKCGESYTKGTNHTCPTVTCDKCGESYTKGTNHTCPAPAPVKAVTFVVKVNTSDNVIFSGSKVPSNGEYVLVGDLLTHCWNSSWKDSYTFDHAYRYALNGANGSTTDANAMVYAGEEVHIMLKTKSTNSGSSSSNTPANGGVNDYYKDEAKKDIWLYIYTNTNMTTPSKRILLNDYTIVSDGVVNKSEIISVIDDYYYASNSNNGIVWKGMYKESFSNVASNLQFIQGQLFDELSGLNEDRYQDVTVIMARVTGVNARASSTADSTNPKTGDMIFAPVAVMGLSASALAVLFFLNKKRAVK